MSFTAHPLFIIDERERFVDGEIIALILVRSLSTLLIEGIGPILSNYLRDRDALALRGRVFS